LACPTAAVKANTASNILLVGCSDKFGHTNETQSLAASEGDGRCNSIRGEAGNNSTDTYSAGWGGMGRCSHYGYYHRWHWHQGHTTVARLLLGHTTVARLLIGHTTVALIFGILGSRMGRHCHHIYTHHTCAGSGLDAHHDPPPPPHTHTHTHAQPPRCRFPATERSSETAPVRCCDGRYIACFGA
jgi:hypothetical protein